MVKPLQNKFMKQIFYSAKQDNGMKLKSIMYKSFHFRFIFKKEKIYINSQTNVNVRPFQNYVPHFSFWYNRDNFYRKRNVSQIWRIYVMYDV